MGIPASRKSARDVLRVSSMMLSYVWPCSSTGISTASFYVAGGWWGRCTTAELDMAGQQRTAACSLVPDSAQRAVAVSRDPPLTNPAVPTTSGISGGSMAGRLWLRWLNLRVSPRSISVDTHPYSQFE